MTILLNFLTEEKKWLRLPRLRVKLQAAASATAKYLGASLQAKASATILLTGDAAVKRLNADFRGIDKATNVLSFPQHEPARVRRLAKKKAALELGDIALAYRFTFLEAKDEGKKVPDHAVHLGIHGLLHLMGYNHETEATARKMEKAEIEIMASLGLPDPYTDSRTTK
ncbi:MAG: rRNA maturation RNase YbeY [Alphaproteobacteria bacterium]|nr:rRNA maturation RNase YbeY [Alphaproteobacteria bacterium]